jgi:hypothetical protein
MQNKRYEKLDSLIVKAISKSNRNPIYDRAVSVEALRIERETGRLDVRVVDGRLIALSKSGAIRYLKKSEAPEQKAGWYVVPTTR